MGNRNFKIVAMVAMTEDQVIGINNDLPWHLPEDLKLFKRTTSGFPILMGRKTWDSIGRPLPNRRNIVLTRDESWSAEGAEVIHSIKDIDTLNIQEEKLFIIGGAEVYKLCLPILDELLVSHVYQTYEGTTYFPEFKNLFSAYSVEETYSDFELRKYVK